MARSIACESLEGVQEESKRTTRVAAVRLRPRLPARVEMRSSRASLSCVRRVAACVHAGRVAARVQRAASRSAWR